jgi:putative ABC transport system permease protein
MNTLRRLRTRFRALFKKGELDLEMEEEMRAHIELRTQANIEAGMNPGEARLAALRQFGWTESIKETCREQRGTLWLEQALQDLQYGWRTLWKSPGFTAVSVLTLTLGVGANSAVFSLVNAMLLRRSPYPDVDQLVRVQKQVRYPWETRTTITDFLDASELADWRRDNQDVIQLAPYSWGEANLSGTGEAEHVDYGAIGDSFLPVLGAQPVLGRNFLPEEDRPGGAPAALLSHGLWRRRFGADPGVLGKMIRLDGSPFTVVGVLPPSFRFREHYDVCIPFFLCAKLKGFFSPMPHAVGRLRPGVSRAQAQTAFESRYDAEQEQRRQQQEKERKKDKEHVLLANFEERPEAEVRQSMLVFLGASGFVLLIACANVGNLLLSRGASRQKEFAVRLALGASRGRVVRQLLAESLLLSLLGGLGGLLLARWGCALLRPFASGPAAAVQEVSIDGRVLALTFLVVALTGVIFGLAPAMACSHPAPQAALKEGSRSVSEGRRQRRMREGLVVLEFASAMVLLIGAGLMAKSFVSLLGVNSGFRPDRVLCLTVSLSGSKYPDARSQAAYFQEIMERVRAVPGVQAVGANPSPPFSQVGMVASGIEVEGHPAPPGNQPDWMAYGIVSPDYFRALGIPVISGRAMNDQDREGAPRVVVVNESFARRHFPKENAVGQRLKMGKDFLTIVGVVGDVRPSPSDAPQPQFLLSYLQSGTPRMTLAIRTTRDPRALAGAVRARILSLDPEQAAFGVQTLEEQLQDSLAPRRATLMLFGAFSVSALLLALVGIYGVVAYSISLRTQEIGIRMALGGQRADVLRLVLGQGLWMIAGGVLLGMAGALALTRFLASQLFALSPTDPVTFTEVTLLLAGAALLACLRPALRASRVDPMTALRCE